MQKAYEMYLDRRLVHGDERLSSVLDELGYTTGAGYQIWANQAAFRADLQVFIAENIEYASLKTIAHKIAELAAQDLPFDQHVLRGGDQYFEVFIGREEFYLTLRFFAMAEDRPDEIREALLDSYERSAWETTELFNMAFDRFDLRIKPHLQMSDLTAAATALVEGYALRGRIQPEVAERKVEYMGATHYTFSVAFLALVREFTESIAAGS
ncbi:MAG: hypothetical protein ACR2QK_21550 [Acidimicrobiales bacterium]